MCYIYKSRSETEIARENESPRERERETHKRPKDRHLHRIKKRETGKEGRTQRIKEIAMIETLTWN